MIPNYEAKMNHIRERQKGNCAIAESLGEKAQITHPHHRLHKSKVNVAKYPLFIDSTLNLLGVNHAYHMKYPHFGKITFLRAARIEAMLERHPALSKQVNDPVSGWGD